MNELVKHTFKKIRIQCRDLYVYTRVIGAMGFIYFLFFRQNEKTHVKARKIAELQPTLRNLTSDVHLCNQIFQRKEYDIDFPFTPRTIIDAGANIGLSALWFKQRFPEATIVAIEPLSSNYLLLLKNCSPCQGYILYKAALWHKKTGLAMKDWGTGLVGYSAYERSSDSSEPVGDQVPSITLNEILYQHHLPKPVLLKLDIEGGEKLLFDHAEKWIDLVDGIIVELHDRKIDGCANSYTLIKANFPIEGRLGENEYCFRRLE